MQAVLISINPQWCELIASGAKTVEVRKTRPTIEPPFKVYIYETKSSDTIFAGNPRKPEHLSFGRGKVIGEFVCDKILNISHKDLTENYRRLTKDVITPSCLRVQDLKDYLGYKDGYGWHISNLVIYDKPRELSEFSKYGFGKFVPLKMPPLSWCYVEV